MNSYTANNPHPFAHYLRQLGRGKSSTRSLTREEACAAMAMILHGDVEEIQIGAFLLLLRVKEETPDELAGFIDAAREAIAAPKIQVDLDWSSYAGKRRQPPWFLLAALALADNGYRVFMHGTKGHTANRCYSEDMLRALGVSICQNWQDVETQIDARQFAYMPLAAINPELERLINLKPILGLRSPVNSFARLMNPLHAPVSVQAIFHPAYALHHQHTAQLVGQQNACVFKGDGGEFERRLEADTRAYYISNGIICEEKWPRLTKEKRADEEPFNVELMQRIWHDDLPAHHGTQIIIATLSVIAPLFDQRCNSLHTSTQWAKSIWHHRKH
jgi:anthranilate phosphoribosyltransferase